MRMWECIYRTTWSTTMKWQNKKRWKRTYYTHIWDLSDKWHNLRLALFSRCWFHSMISEKTKKKHSHTNTVAKVILSTKQRASMLFCCLVCRLFLFVCVYTTLLMLSAMNGAKRTQLRNVKHDFGRYVTETLFRSNKIEYVAGHRSVCAACGDSTEKIKQTNDTESKKCQRKKDEEKSWEMT